MEENCLREPKKVCKLIFLVLTETQLTPTPTPTPTPLSLSTQYRSGIFHCVVTTFFQPKLIVNTMHECNNIQQLAVYIFQSDA